MRRRVTDLDQVVAAVLLAFMVATAVAIAIRRNLFAVVILAAIFSMLSAAFFVVQDAVDVAFTEAAVGAGISTVLMLATLTLTGDHEKPTHHDRVLALIVVVVTGAALVYGTWDMPALGDPAAPVHQVTRYVERMPSEIGVPNAVTAVLASYRGHDTLGEVTVIFTAGVGVMLLLGRYRRG